MIKGKFNHLIIILGVPGTGKTTYAVKRARQIQKETRCLIVAQDKDYRFPEEDRTIVHYDTYQEMVTGMASRPGALHCITSGRGEVFIEWARQCGQSSVANPKKEGPPILAMIDDSTQIKGFSRRGIDDDLLEALTGRRHKHTGFIVTVQDPQFAHYSLLSQSTEIVIFRMIDEDAIKKLKKFGVSPEMQAKVETLPDYHCIVHNTQTRQSQIIVKD